MSKKLILVNRLTTQCMAKLEVYQLIDENDKEVAEVGSVHHGDR